MFKLAQKRKEDEKRKAEASKTPGFEKQMSVRSRYLTQEVSELQPILPSTCQLDFKDVDDLRKFYLIITPKDGYWKGGRFIFQISIPPEYNIKPPIAVCRTKIWHPNITENGDICLSILREHAMDGTGWLPTRTLKDVVWGLDALFNDLLNFDDPLNVEAAEQYTRDKYAFERKVREYINNHALL